MEQQVNKDPTNIATKPRNAFIAFMLSLLVPGLGQFYNGQPKKAIIFFGLLLLFPLVFGLTRGTTFFYGMLTLFAMEIVLRISAMIDAVKNAKRQKNYVLKPYNTWYYHLFIAMGMLATIYFFDTSRVLGTQTYLCTNTSNSPTFQVGDRHVADMKAYKNKEPDYGDIVVYSRPDGDVYIFRVVARPNDTLEIIDNIVSINGKPGKSTYIKDTTCENIPVAELEEMLPNGHKHLIYTFKQPFDSTKTNIKNIVVPSDSYFLLGDNRDNAADSRYEGFISKNRIKGRIIYSYWGQTTDRINLDFRDK